MSRRLERLTASCAALGAAAAPALGTAPAAWAHHAAIAGTLACDHADLVVSAWDGSGASPEAVAASRTNGGVAVSESVDGGPFTPLPQPAHALGAPGFAFSVSAPVPGDARTVAFRTQSTAPWADGGPSGDSRATSAVTVPECGTLVSFTDSGATAPLDPPVPPLTGGQVHHASPPAAQASGMSASTRTVVGGVAVVVLVAALARLAVRANSRRSPAVGRP